MKPANHWANQIQNELRGDETGAAEFRYLCCVVGEIQDDARIELKTIEAERDGACAVIEALKAENLRIRKIAAHVPPKLWLEAEYAAGHARQIKTNEPGRTDDWSARERKEGLH